MKSFSHVFLFLAVSVLICARAHAIESGDLSLAPIKQCRPSPKAPPYKQLHREFQAANTPSNSPFIRAIDINGDGWCDWVSTAAMPPHSGDIDEPSMQSFIFLGTETGWRKFGDMQKFKSDPSAMSFSLPLLTSTDSAASFIAPVAVYSKKSASPYIASIFLNEDVLDPYLGSVSVYQWDDSFDSPRRVSEEDRSTVITFLQEAMCKPGKDYGHAVSVAGAICGKQPELVK